MFKEFLNVADEEKFTILVVPLSVVLRDIITTTKPA